MTFALRRFSPGIKRGVPAWDGAGCSVGEPRFRWTLQTFALRRFSPGDQEVQLFETDTWPRGWLWALPCRGLILIPEAEATKERRHEGSGDLLCLTEPPRQRLVTTYDLRWDAGNTLPALRIEHRLRQGVRRR